MQLENFMNAVKTWKHGQIHTLVYETREKRKGLLDFSQESTQQFMYGVDYENRAKVKEYRETTGAGPNNPATKNEVATDLWGVYLNPVTNTIKFRVSMQGLTALGRTYKIGGKEVSKEVYYSEMEARGYSKPKYYAPKTDVAFKSFNVDNIISIK